MMQEQDDFQNRADEIQELVLQEQAFNREFGQPETNPQNPLSVVYNEWFSKYCLYKNWFLNAKVQAFETSKL